MGLTSTVIINSDALDKMENDSQFGKILSDAIKTTANSGPVQVQDSLYTKDISVIETHHSGNTVLVSVNGSTSRVIGTLTDDSKNENIDRSTVISILKDVTDNLGWCLTDLSLRKGSCKI